MERESFKSGFVSIVGRPNVGKSTLMNRIIGQKIAITSNKPQTTRNRIQTVFHDERGQIIFVDTPGIHKAKNRLGEYMVGMAESTIREVDIIIWVVEATTYIGKGEKHIIEQLKKADVPVFLVMNKIDNVKKEELFECIETYKDELEYAEIIPISARTGDGVDVLVDEMFKYLEEGPAFYGEDTVTDQPERQIVAELIREKALRLLSDEIPHGIAVTIEQMKIRHNNKRIYDIEATIICERSTHKGIIIGKEGKMLRKITSLSKKEIEEFLEKKVNLNIWVKVKKDWRDSDFLLKNYGYNKEE